MEGPPPLLDESSDDGAWIESENDSEGSGTDESWNGSDVPGSPSWLLAMAAQSILVHDSGTGSNSRVHLEEAANFVLARMKQKESGLQAWDHADFVRMANQSVLFQRSWKPLVVLQEAQAAAFVFGGQQKTSLINLWHGRRPGGVVKCIRDLGTLRQLRGSRLVPFRLGCNCLYDHPALTNLCNTNASDRGLPRLMHINPSMSGPVRILTMGGVRPYCVAFAGAEFVVRERTRIGNDEFWVVHVELREFMLNLDQLADSGPATLGLEGLPNMHARLGTHEAVGVVKVSTESMQTLLNGQAPTDIDRFKAWNMDQRYHAVSHHVWGLDDLRVFMFMHRMLLTFAPLLTAFYQRCSVFKWIVAIVATATLAVWKPTSDELMNYYFHSTLGTLVVLCTQVFLFVYEGLLYAIAMASSLARELLGTISELPHFLFPSRVPAGRSVIWLLAYKLLRFAAECAIQCYTRALRMVLNRVPDYLGLRSVVRFIDAALRFVANLLMMGLISVVSLFWWWYVPNPEPEYASMRAKYEATAKLTSAEAKAGMLSAVRAMVFGVRGEIALAAERLERAVEQGACRCTGGRRSSPHACSAALAVAAVRQKRMAPSKEKSAIERILVNSGIIRDSLVRTARVMLALHPDKPDKAVEEVAHELMHAAQAGLIWPDERLICLRLNSEGVDYPTAETVAWHRAKWVAVAANMIVDRESSPHPQESWIQAAKQQDRDINYRLCAIPPSERCVSCYANYARQSGDRTISGATKHMKTDGRNPPSCKETSACKLAVTEGPRPTSRPHYEMPMDDCRVPVCNPREFPESDDFPFYHVAARQPKLEPDHARRLAARIASIDETCARMVRRDTEIAKAGSSRAAAAAAAASRSKPKRTPTLPAPPVSPQQPPAPQQQRQPQRKKQRQANSQANSQQQRQDPAPQEMTENNLTPPPVLSSRSSETSRDGGSGGGGGGGEDGGQKDGVKEQNSPKTEDVLARERMAAQEERRLRRAKARKERAMDAEAVKRQRLQMLTSDMQDVLETCPDPDEPGLADGSCTSNRNSSSSKNGSKENKKAGQGVAKPGPKDRSSTTTTAGGGGKEKKGEVVEEEEEEEEDELTLCIVCMTEKRNACLVHGKTSHQIVCLPCGDRLKAAKMGCPVCKRPIQAVIENFTS